MTRAFTLAAFALTMLSGRVLDRTTGQALAHVRVVAGTASATTDAAGHFTLRGIKAGSATVVLESDDVPAQRFSVTVKAGATEHDFRACSTTLDYDCGAPAAPQNGGNGAG